MYIGIVMGHGARRAQFAEESNRTQKTSTLEAAQEAVGNAKAVRVSKRPSTNPEQTGSSGLTSTPSSEQQSTEA